MLLEKSHAEPQQLELKYTFDNSARERVLRSLAGICRKDTKFAEGWVNSIYFDTDDWLLAMEKASSDYLKTKIRIRWYQTTNNDETQLSSCYFEVKRKFGTQRRKIRIPLDADGSNIQSKLGEPRFLTEVSDIIAKHTPEFSGHNIRPAFKVAYLRRRFLEPTTSSRIALDTHIQAEAVGAMPDFENTRIDLPYPVLEVKGYVDELPHALRYINAPNLYKMAFSKYYLCFKALTGYSQ